MFSKSIQINTKFLSNSKRSNTVFEDEHERSPPESILVSASSLADEDRQCAHCETWLSGRVAEMDGKYYHKRCFFEEYSVSDDV